MTKKQSARDALEQKKRYMELMMPSYLERREKDKQLLKNLFTLFHGSNKCDWHIIDPIMAEVFPNDIYEKEIKNQTIQTHSVDVLPSIPPPPIGIAD